jgi:leader peptidase (prepilin peptidase)/N-methyltransferase
MNMTLLTIDAAFVGLLGYLSIYDIRHLILPDAATLALAILGGAFVAISETPTFAEAGIGALMGAGILWLARLLFRYLRHTEGLGLGDVKLLAAGGLWIGWSGIGPALVIATLAGLIAYGLRAIRVGRIETELPLPFGPFLSFGIATIHFMA